MKQMSMMVDLNRCIGCKTCIVACRNHHEIIDHTKAMPDQMPYYLRVETRERGSFPDLSMDTWVVPCQHCPDPPCRSACPQAAISKDSETGVVRIDREKCDGCDFKPEMKVEDKVMPAPCKLSCPAGLNVQGYVQLVKQGKYEDAIKLILKRVPLPGVLGRVCPHPCEEVCRRKEVDDPVSIRELKRTAADKVNFEQLEVPKIKENNHKVAVIGSGPAGLTAAYDLRLMGYKVTIFEALDVLGGMLRVGIPDYRLPVEVLDEEIGYLLRHGIETRTGVRFGTDVTMQDLTEEGFGAVLLGIGLQSAVELKVPGSDAENVVDAVRFLREINLGTREQIGKSAVIVGGGNMAIDAARATKRLGCPKVTVVCLEDESDMPAYVEEIEGARQEEIEFVTLAGPMEVALDKGKVVGLKCTKVEPGVLFDEFARPMPVPVKGSEFVIKCDTIIPAIGRKMDAPWMSNGTDLATTAGGAFHVSHQMQTTVPYVFAAGDAVRGPASVIQAISDGHAAAEAIHRYLQGLPLLAELAHKEEAPPPEQYRWMAVPSGICETAPREKAAYVDPGERSVCFLEECLGLTDEQAQSEANRCLNCGCSCMQSCPFDVIQFDNQAGTSHKCDLCYDLITAGKEPVCVDVCLTEALSFGERELLQLKAKVMERTTIEALSRASHIYVK